MQTPANMKIIRSLFLVVLLTTGCTRNTEEASSGSNPPPNNDNVSMKLDFDEESNYSSKDGRTALKVRKTSDTTYAFKLVFAGKSGEIKVEEIATLVRLEDADGTLYVPEGTPIEDTSTGEEYQCDSTFDYTSSQGHVAFGLETLSRKRAFLVTSRFTTADIPEGIFTLYKIRSSNNH